MYHSYWLIPECNGDADNIVFKQFSFHNTLNWKKKLSQLYENQNPISEN